MPQVNRFCPTHMLILPNGAKADDFWKMVDAAMKDAMVRDQRQTFPSMELFRTHALGSEEGLALLDRAQTRSDWTFSIALELLYRPETFQATFDIDQVVHVRAWMATFMNLFQPGWLVQFMKEQISTEDLQGFQSDLEYNITLWADCVVDYLLAYLTLDDKKMTLRTKEMERSMSTYNFLHGEIINGFIYLDRIDTSGMMKLLFSDV